jgi:hypothetical protein
VKPSQLSVDGVVYYDGQTAYVECSKTSVYVSIPAVYSYVDNQQVEANVDWSASSNFSIQSIPQGLNSQKSLQLDVNRNDGFIKASYSGLNDFITIYIKQKPTPFISSIPAACSAGQSGIATAQVTYNFQSTKPINLVWQTSGGLTVNGNTSYTQTNATNSSVTIQYSSSGNFSVYGVIPGCNNLQTPSASAYLGTPTIGTVIVDNSNVNPGPVAVSSNSTHYIQAISSDLTPPTFSFSTTTNSGNISLFLSGVNGGNCQVNVSGSVGNAALHIAATNICNTFTRDIIFYIPSGYRIASNPVKDQLIITFDSVDYLEGLPDAIEITSEKQMKIVRSVNIQDIFKQKSFKNGKQIEFDVRDLPRGVYYLRVLNQRQEKQKQIEVTRLVFE